jgi:predicted O-methyltransferase YrrM
MRYKQLIEQVSLRLPERIIEIGTWNGGRAIEMLNASPASEYVGFDLFEEADENTDRKEFNVKQHYTRDLVGTELAKYHSGITLIKGDTNSTFKEYNQRVGSGTADFIFIDGGHSVETIASDWENALYAAKPGGIIMLDDYYEVMPEETLAKIGCNTLVKTLGPPFKINILPIADLVKGGGFVKMVKIQVPYEHNKKN